MKYEKRERKGYRERSEWMENFRREKLKEREREHWTEKKYYVEKRQNEKSVILEEWIKKKVELI